MYFVDLKKLYAARDGINELQHCSEEYVKRKAMYAKKAEIIYAFHCDATKFP